MRDNRHILRAHETLRAEARTPTTDGRVGSTHDRHNRSFVCVDYRGTAVLFYPIKRWPATLGVSVVTLRLWLKRGVITAMTKHNMHVMCLAELKALAHVIAAWYTEHSQHQEIDPRFRVAAYASLLVVRTALDRVQRGHALSAAEHTALSPSFEESHAYSTR